MSIPVKRRPCKPDELYSGHIDYKRPCLHSGIQPGGQAWKEREPDEGIPEWLPAGL